PLWMRYSAISPNGKEIVFSYKGDIFKVPVTGGRAIQLTTHVAHDTRPVWSPDGKQIAFSSNREKNFNIYLMPAEGGAPTRLTTHSSNAYPITFRSNESILYTSNIKPDAEDGEFPSRQFDQVYEVSTKGGRPTLFSSLTMEDISIDTTGTKLLYHDKKGYEDPWRKRHTSSITRDVWLFDKENNSYKKLTTFKGENRTPRWSADGQSFYYLSEQDGSFNVYKRGLNDTKATKLTNFEDNPVRFLTVSNNGTLSFAFNGEIYTMQEQGEPKKVSIQIIKDNQEDKLKYMNLTSGIKEMAVSPSGKEIAFIVRGDVFVTSVEYGTTRRITNTPDQERDVSYSPDGRSILYAAERNGHWNLYQTSLIKKDEKSFLYATNFKEEQLTDSDLASFQPLYSPDGKEIAYLHNRTEIRVLNLKSKESRTVLEGKFNYSYSDGDQWYRWAPDSKWILAKYIAIGGWNNTDVALINADGSGQVTNLTESGYTDSNPRFAQDGKAMIWFSDRAGYRSHGSWGAHRDAYIMFFDSEAYDKFRMSKEEVALLKDDDKKEDDDKDKKDDKKSKKDEEAKKKEVDPLKFELENRRDRIIRLTPNSSSVVDAMLNKDGDKLYYLTSFEKDFDLWEYDLKKRSSKILSKAT
ncbi:MAG: peptidase S41, partial [Bacteroidales bacterium]|nr:peptidase S41 [Bacteroidales bacterium]